MAISFLKGNGLFLPGARNGSILVIEGPKQVMLSSTWQSAFLAPGKGKFTVPDDREVVGKILTDTSFWMFVCCVYFLQVELPR